MYEVKKLRIDFLDLKLEVIGSPSSDRYKDYELNIKAEFNSELQLGWLKKVLVAEVFKLQWNAEVFPFKQSHHAL